MHIAVAASLPGFGFPDCLVPCGSESTGDCKEVENAWSNASLGLATRGGIRVCYTER